MLKIAQNLQRMVNMSNKLSVLIVDDNIINRKYFSMSLKKHGYQTTTAEGGFEAIKLTQSIQFDIILMDIRMPDIDGHKTAEKIRQLFNYKDIPILATSAEIIEPENQSMFDEFLLKPISPTLLSQTIEKHTKYHFNNKPNFNRKSALKYAYNDTQIMHEIIMLFLKDLPHQFTLLKNNLENNQYKTCCDLIHKIRGSCKACGADRLDQQLALLAGKIKVQEINKVLLTEFTTCQHLMSSYCRSIKDGLCDGEK